jgi:hypothetical protein
MPITMYASLGTMVQTTDPDLCVALESLTQRPVVQVHQVEACKRHWWSRRRTQRLYSVLWPLGDTPLGHEWQVVSFYRERYNSTDSDVNTVVPKELVLAYLYGCGAGERQHNEEHTR